MPNAYRIFIDRQNGKLLRAPDSYQMASIQDMIRAADDSQIPIELIPLDAVEGGGYEPASYATDDVRLAIGNTSEVPTGGTFELVHSGNNSEAINVEHLNADVIERALNNIASIDSAGGVQVTRNALGYMAQAITNGALGAITADEVSLVPHGTVSIVELQAGSATTKGAYQINLKADPYALLTNWSALSAASIALSTIKAGSSTQYETQRIAITGAVRGGYFTISDGSSVTAALNYDASAADVEDALNGILGANTITIDKPNSRTWDIRWTSVGDKTALTVDGALTSWSGLAGTLQLNTTSLAASIAGKGSIPAVAQIVETITASDEKIVYSEDLELEEEVVSNATLTTIATGLIGSLNGTAVFTAATKAAEVPDYVGQVGVETDTGIIYRATATSAGSWTRITYTDGIIVVNYSEFAAAIAAIGSTAGKIVIADNITLTANATIPVNCTLEFPLNGKTIDTNGFTLEIDGGILAASTQQIFENYSAGDIYGTFGGVDKRPEWWGAKADFVPGLSYYPSPTTLNISAGAISVGTTGKGYKVAGSAIPASDNLDTISGSPGVGDQIVLFPANHYGTIVVKDGTGNISLGITGGDKTLDADNKWVALEWSGSVWNEIAETVIEISAESYTDSTAAFQACIDAGKNGNPIASSHSTGNIQLSGGNYLISKELDCTMSNAHIKGQGYLTTQIYIDDSDAATDFPNGFLFRAGSNNPPWNDFAFCISDMTIRGRTSPLCNVGMFEAQDDMDAGFMISRIDGKHFGGRIISLPTGTKALGFVVEKCHFGTIKRGVDYGIYIGGSVYTCAIKDTTLNTQQEVANDQTGIYFAGLGPLHVDGVHFENQLYNVIVEPVNSSPSAATISNCFSAYSVYPVMVNSASNRPMHLEVNNFRVDSSLLAGDPARALMIDYQVGAWMGQEIGGADGGNGGTFSYSRRRTTQGTTGSYIYKPHLPTLVIDPNHKPTIISDTIDSISGNEITMAGHTFGNGTRVMLTNDTDDANLPTGLNGSTHYYIKKKANSTSVVTLALQPGGSDVTISSAGTGTHTIYEVKGAVTTLTRDGLFRLVPGYEVVALDTYASASSDDITSIVGGYNGQRVTLKAFSDIRTIVVKHDTGTTADTIHLHNGRDAVMRSNYDTITLVRSNNVWLEVGRSLISDTVENYTIATGVVTIDHSVERIFLTGEGGVADDLDTINGGYNGQVIICSALSSFVDITAKDGTGNLALAGDFVMDHAQDTITLVYWQSVWKEVSRSGNSA